MDLAWPIFPGIGPCEKRWLSLGAGGAMDLGGLDSGVFRLVHGEVLMLAGGLVRAVIEMVWGGK